MNKLLYSNMMKYNILYIVSKVQLINKRIVWWHYSIRVGMGGFPPFLAPLPFYFFSPKLLNTFFFSKQPTYYELNVLFTPFLTTLFVSAFRPVPYCERYSGVRPFLTYNFCKITFVFNFIAYIVYIFQFLSSYSLNVM